MPSYASPASGMRVPGHSRRANAYDTNPLAVIALVVGVASMACQLVPAVGMYVAIPLSITAMALGMAGMGRARRAGGRRMDVAAGGLVMGIASLALSVAVLALLRGSAWSGGLPTQADAEIDQANEESLESLADAAAAAEARGDIVGASWGSGMSRRASDEVITLNRDGSFDAWTGQGDGGGETVTWGGSYDLAFGKDALAAVGDDARQVIVSEVMSSRVLMERNVVRLELRVDGAGGGKASQSLVMIGHYVPGSHELYMRDAEDMGGAPSVLHRLDEKESGI